MTARPAESRIRALVGTRGSSPLTIGLAVWLAAVLLMPAPPAARILLLAPLVVVPRLITLLPARSWIAGLGGWPALAAALALIAAFSIAQGPVAAGLAVPWLACSALGTAGAIRHGLQQLPSILGPRHFPALGIDVALGFWAVGALFIVVDRLGIDAGFPPVIVLLSATHFHFAGFGLLAIASFLATSRPWLQVAVLGLIIGIPVTAIGFIVAANPINALGALIVGTSGIAVGIGLLSGRVSARADWLSRAAGLALLIGMPMGIAWSFSILTAIAFVDLDTMIRTHGALNATAVLLATAAHRINP